MFHIKLSNSLLRDDLNLAVIDCEQCGANSFTLALEANGSFDATIPDSGTLVHTAYDGPARTNNPIGKLDWNVSRSGLGSVRRR